MAQAKVLFASITGNNEDIADIVAEALENNGIATEVDDIDFELSLLAVDQIDVRYILNLVQSIDLTSKEQQEKDVEVIKKAMENTANTDGLRLKADLIQKFLEEVIPTLGPNDNIGNSLNEFLAKEREKAVDDFSKETKLSESQIDEMFNEYKLSGGIDSEKLTTELNDLGYGFLQNRKVVKKTISFIKETSEKYTAEI